jgi:hypothetical protein
MLKMKILLFLFSLKTALCDCNSEVKRSGFEKGRSSYKVVRLGRVPHMVNEGSGIVQADSLYTFWTHNDGGSNPTLYKIASDGGLLDSIHLANTKNIDWEDLAKDAAGNLYIGDFGNNLNRRKDLTIYKLHPKKPEAIQQITYRYQDQQSFPPAKEEMNFDCEAFFEHSGQLYLFSKNRGNKQVKMYTIPNKTGDYAAQAKEEVFLKSQVTAADVNPSKNMFALLSYGKVFLFEMNNEPPTFQNPYFCIKVARGQAEALAFVNDTDFVITNEKGKMFLVQKKK